MKKILFLTLLSLLVNCLVSCDNSSITKIKQGIAEGNKDCPLDLGMIGVLQSMTFNDDTKCVEWLCVVNEEVVLLDMMKNNVEDVRRNLEAFITNGAYKSTMKMMADAGVGLTMTYRWASTNDDIPFVFTSDDILKLFDNPLSDQEANMMKLRSVLTSENDNCPYAVEQGLVMQQVYDDGRYIVYVCQVDETLYEMSNLSALSGNMKTAMVGMFDDLLIKSQLKTFNALGRGLIYRYVGDSSGEKMEITFTDEELGELL